MLGRLHAIGYMQGLREASVHHVAAAQADEVSAGVVRLHCKTVPDDSHHHHHLELRSMLDLDIPYVSDAEHRLHQLVVQRSQRLIGAAVLLAVTVATVFVFPEVAFGFAAGAAAAVAAALIALDRRRSLTAQLIQTRAAYNIDYVARTGAQFASRARRGRLAAWLRDIVRIAEHQEVRGSYTTPIIEQRVIERK